MRHEEVNDTPPYGGWMTKRRGGNKFYGCRTRRTTRSYRGYSSSERWRVNAIQFNSSSDNARAKSTAITGLKMRRIVADFFDDGEATNVDPFVGTSSSRKSDVTWPCCLQRSGKGGCEKLSANKAASRTSSSSNVTRAPACWSAAAFSRVPVDHCAA